MGASHAAKQKKDGQPRSIAFRKELSRTMLKPWKNAWHLRMGEMPRKSAYLYHRRAPMAHATG